MDGIPVMLVGNKCDEVTISPNIYFVADGEDKYRPGARKLTGAWAILLNDSN
jgi:hypothetical protein